MNPVVHAMASMAMGLSCGSRPNFFTCSAPMWSKHLTTHH